jgi:hypothetical protein
MLMLLAASPAIRGDYLEKHHLDHHHHRQYEGGYYPGPYYSRAYIQQFPLDPGDRILLYRLRPFQHYGRYEYGCPIEPNLTRGTVESFRFPYRYQWGFRPTPEPQPLENSNCDHPLARRYRSIDSPSTNSDMQGDGRANEPAELPRR